MGYPKKSLPGGRRRGAGTFFSAISESFVATRALLRTIFASADRIYRIKREDDLDLLGTDDLGMRIDLFNLAHTLAFALRLSSIQ